MLFLKDNVTTKKFMVILLLCLFAVTLFPVVVSADARVDIFGYVRDDDTGNPIYNARVDLFYDYDSVPFISIYSDNNGRIDASIYAGKTVKRAEITRAGYKKALHTIANYAGSIDLGTKYLVAGSVRENNYRVYGTVLDDRDSAPISDARVVLIDDYERITYDGYTNARGKFDVVNLPPGDYEVLVTKYGYRDYEMRNLLRLRVGDYDLGTIFLEKTGSYSSTAPSARILKGRVTDEDGYFVQGAEVYLLDDHGEEIKTKTDARGYYTFQDIAVKTYTIGVAAPGYELLERIDFVRITAADTEKEINLMVNNESRRGYDVYGRVVDENRAYLAGVEVSLIDGNTRIKRVQTDAQGYYEFKYVPDGRYNIEFKKLGYQTYTLFNAIRVDGSYCPVPQTELHERRGDTTVVGGLVGDGQSGLNNITVYLESSASSASSASTKTNYYGFFTFSDVKEGSYNLYAAINNTKKLLVSNLRVAGSRTDVGDINIHRIDSGYKVSGQVQDAGRKKIANAKISLTAGGVSEEAITAGDGSYALTGLKRGEYTITVTKEGYGVVSEKINIISYDLEKDFTLTANDYVKVNYTAVSLAVNEKIDLNKYLSNVEIYSASGSLLDDITSRYEATVPAAYADYLEAYANNEIKGKKVGTAYLEISIRNSRDFKNLSAARLPVKITEPLREREAVLTIGTNRYTLDGKTELSDAVPYIRGGRSFFPLRVMAMVMGVTEKNIKWDPLTRTATLIKGDDVAEFTVGKDYYKHNGTTLLMDARAENILGRIYLPARYVAEALGGEIEWDGETKTLTIKSK